MRIKLPGSDKNKRIILIILIIISVIILINEGMSNKSNNIKNKKDNSVITTISTKEEKDNTEKNNFNVRLENKSIQSEKKEYVLCAEENELYNEAYKLFFSNEYEKAIEKANNIIIDYPDNYMAYNIRGIAKAYSGDYENGMMDIDKSLEMNEDYAYAIFNKALTYELYGKLDDALNWYNKALEKEKYVWSYYGIASIYGRRGDIDNTILYLDKAIELDPTVKENAKIENDFDPVKNSEKFKRVIYN